MGGGGAIYAKGTSDFDAQMSGIHFWKGDENLKICLLKTVFQNIDIEWLLQFWTFNS
jgi:hypothetical protein